MEEFERAEFEKILIRYCEGEITEVEALNQLVLLLSSESDKVQ